MRLWFALPLAVFAALAAVFAYLLVTDHDPAALPSTLIDRPAPAFALPPLREGGPGLSRDDLGGRVVLVNFFASWCVPCRAEHPLLTRLAAEKGITVLGINYKDKPEDARAWLDRLGDPYAAIGIDPDGRAAIEWGIYGVPETFVVDPEGRVRLRHAGPLMPKDVETTILPLVERLSR